MKRVEHIQKIQHLQRRTFMRMTSRTMKPKERREADVAMVEEKRIESWHSWRKEFAEASRDEPWR